MTDIALITGAGGALGGEVARAMRARGASLVLVDAPQARERLEGLAAALGGACVVLGDASAESTWVEAMPRIVREVGGAPTSAALVAGTWRGGKPLH